MSIFSRKKEIGLEETCRIFYDNVLLNCNIGGRDINKDISDIVRNTLIAVDNNFADVDPQKFDYEFIILQFELFALAWLHQFGDQSAVEQSIFTKKYLEEKERKSIWNDMEKYNIAISRSTGAGLSETNIASIMKKRADLADKYLKVAEERGIEVDESIGRPINRTLSESAWNKGATAGFLLFTLCDRLGFDADFQPNKDAHSRWLTEIRNFYDNTRNSLKKIRIK